METISSKIGAMKRKLLLGLALVLSGGLVGCSTVPSGALSNSVEGKLFSNQDAVCLKSNDSSRPWQLKYALSDNSDLFITVHERGDDVEGYDNLSKWRPEYTAAIYAKTNGKFKLLKRLSTEGLSYFSKPAIFPAHIERPDIKDDWKQLIQITEVYYGSGGLTSEHIFTADEMNTVDENFQPFKITRTVTLEEVEFIPAWKTYRFGKDEQVWKGAWNTLGDEKLSFGFLVWKTSEKGLVPVDKITGTYKLEPKSGGKFQIVVDTLKHETVKDEDWH
jgi:hypothetical protein